MEEMVIPGVDRCRALVRYEGPVRQLVTDLKYRNDRRLLGRLADELAGMVDPPSDAVVTWVPTTAVRRRRRGYDQAALLARALARRWRRPCRRLLDRTHGPPQTGRSMVERQQGVALVYCGRRPVTVPVVVVDDVVTTGATLRSGASVLREAGAPWVGAVAIARTPRGLT
jgi:predicted amidophosphoribosyltransferase